MCVVPPHTLRVREKEIQSIESRFVSSTAHVYNHRIYMSMVHVYNTQVLSQAKRKRKKISSLQECVPCVFVQIFETVSCTTHVSSFPFSFCSYCYFLPPHIHSNKQEQENKREKLCIRMMKKRCLLENFPIQHIAKIIFSFCTHIFTIIIVMTTMLVGDDDADGYKF